MGTLRDAYGRLLRLQHLVGIRQRVQEVPTPAAAASAGGHTGRVRGLPEYRAGRPDARFRVFVAGAHAWRRTADAHDQLRDLSRGLSLGECDTPVELVEDEWWVTPMDIIPPRHVMNALFATGGSRLGFTWASFTIDAEEWKEIVAAFEGSRLPDHGSARGGCARPWTGRCGGWRSPAGSRPEVPSLRRPRRVAERAQIQDAAAAGDQERMLTLHVERATGKDPMGLLRAQRDGGSRVRVWKRSGLACKRRLVPDCRSQCGLPKGA